MAFPSSKYGAEAKWADIQGILDVLTGVTNGGDQVQLTQYNNSSNYALDVRNLDTTNGYGLRVRDGASANLLTVAKNAIGIGATTTDILTVSATARFADGAVGTPGIAFSSDTNTGLYRIGADNVGLTLGGAKKVDYGASLITVTPQTDFTAGIKLANLHTLTATGGSGGYTDLNLAAVQQFFRVSTTTKTGYVSVSSNNYNASDDPSNYAIGFNVRTDGVTGVPVGTLGGLIHGQNNNLYLQLFTGLSGNWTLVTDTTATDGPLLKVLPNAKGGARGSVLINALGVGRNTAPAVALDVVGSAIVSSGVQVGAPTAGDKGAGTVNVAADVYKNNSAYTNPDYALEHWATGKIERYADRPGAADYPGLMPLVQVEAFAREHWHLPRVSREPAGVFERADTILEKIEELTLYLVDHEHRLAAVEAG